MLVRTSFFPGGLDPPGLSLTLGLAGWWPGHPDTVYVYIVLYVSAWQTPFAQQHTLQQFSKLDDIFDCS